MKHHVGNRGGADDLEQHPQGVGILAPLQLADPQATEAAMVPEAPQRKLFARCRR
jgi:hypothetical protein